MAGFQRQLPLFLSTLRRFGDVIHQLRNFADIVPNVLFFALFVGGAVVCE